MSQILRRLINLYNYIFTTSYLYKYLYYSNKVSATKPFSIYNENKAADGAKRHIQNFKIKVCENSSH